VREEEENTYFLARPKTPFFFHIPFDMTLDYGHDADGSSLQGWTSIPSTWAENY